MTHPTRHRRTTLATVAALGAALPAISVISAAAPADAAPGGTPQPMPCVSPVLDAPTRADKVTSPTVLATAAARTGRSTAWLTERARVDRTLWLDRCGMAFYAEPARAATAQAHAESPAEPTEPTVAAAEPAVLPATARLPLADTFSLESRPGAPRTIYLDFRGGTVSGTAWNSSYGLSTLNVEPFSITAPADTAFTDAELTEIQRAWQVVAEDFAPFDVNVTTKDPGAAALDRTDSSDSVYGIRVRVTAGGDLYDSCGCGGVAYINVFNKTGSSRTYYQPAWVFTEGASTSGKNFGEAISHEVGHNFGLDHDATPYTGYYSGAAPWAPIMGSSYGQPVSHWSRGEYAGATETEDDLAVIATGAPLRSDDHADTAEGATLLATGTPVNGVVATRADVDAFTFTAAGTTTLTVSPAAGLPNLDVELRIADDIGATVATVNPAVARTSSAVATGLGASWTATLPSTPATYTAYVDGVGTGDPMTAGKYSDYGSLGNYQISLETAGEPAPVAVADRSVTATAGTAVSVQLTATGGDGTTSWSAGPGIAPGLTLSGNGLLSGTPTTAGTFGFTVTASSAGTASTGTLTVTVAKPVARLRFATSATLPQGRVHRAYRTKIASTGGSPAYAWKRTGTLPRGTALRLSPDRRAVVLYGKPKRRGVYSFTLTVRDADGRAAARTFRVRVTR